MSAHSNHFSQSIGHAVGWGAMTAVGLGTAVVSCTPTGRDPRPEWEEVAEAPDGAVAPAHSEQPLGASVGGPFFLRTWRLEAAEPHEVQGVRTSGGEEQVTPVVVDRARVDLSSDGTGVTIERLAFQASRGKERLEVVSAEGMPSCVLGSSPHSVHVTAIVPVVLRGVWGCNDAISQMITTQQPLGLLVDLKASDGDAGHGMVTVHGSLPLPTAACQGQVVGLTVKFQASGTFDGADIVR